MSHAGGAPHQAQVECVVRGVVAEDALDNLIVRSVQTLERATHSLRKLGHRWHPPPDATVKSSSGCALLLACRWPCCHQQGFHTHHRCVPTAVVVLGL
jgi:hypothetical protein